MNLLSCLIKLAKIMYAAHVRLREKLCETKISKKGCIFSNAIFLSKDMSNELGNPVKALTTVADIQHSLRFGRDSQSHCGGRRRKKKFETTVSQLSRSQDDSNPGASVL